MCHQDTCPGHYNLSYGCLGINANSDCLLSSIYVARTANLAFRNEARGLPRLPNELFRIFQKCCSTFQTPLSKRIIDAIWEPFRHSSLLWSENELGPKEATLCPQVTKNAEHRSPPSPWETLPQFHQSPYCFPTSTIQTCSRVNSQNCLEMGQGLVELQVQNGGIIFPPEKFAPADQSPYLLGGLAHVQGSTP